MCIQLFLHICSFCTVIFRIKNTGIQIRKITVSTNKRYYIKFILYLSKSNYSYSLLYLKKYFQAEPRVTITSQPKKLKHTRRILIVNKWCIFNFIILLPPERDSLQNMITYHIKSLQWEQKVGCLKNLGMNLWSFIR